ncbi:hypothetical protein HTG_10660 [Natrinema mahii]|nr:hypothetical protein HTG_10660 [Natrinema mahii]
MTVDPRVVLVLLVGFAAISSRLYYPKIVESLLERTMPMLPSTVSHWALAGLGFVVTSEANGTFRWGDVLSFAAVPLVILFVIAGTWLINDIFDKETDEHANPDRPTVRGTVSDRTLWISGGGCVVLAGAFAATVGSFAVAVLGTFLLVNVIYSVPPLRLKSHALTNMLCNGTLGGLSFLLGTAVVVARPTPFVSSLFVAVTIAVSVNIPYWDLKDAKHDAKSGSDTIVVRYGAENVRRGLMIALPATYFVFVALLALFEWVPVFAGIAALAVYVLHARRDDYQQLAYELDLVNGLNHVVLAAVYVLS